MGIAEDIPVKIKEFFIPVNFVVLDMHPNSKVSLILGRPFLSTANTHIDVGLGEVKFNINGREERFPFKPRLEFITVDKINEVEEEQSLGSPSSGLTDTPVE
jgi:hypothetical protein